MPVIVVFAHLVLLQLVFSGVCRLSPARCFEMKIFAKSLFYVCSEHVESAERKLLLSFFFFLLIHFVIF